MEEVIKCVFIVDGHEYIEGVKREIQNYNFYNDIIEVVERSTFIYGKDYYKDWITIEGLPAKKNALVLDMAGNLREHGGLGAPYTGGKAKDGKPQPRGRVCPVCETFNEGINLSDCADCGYIWIKEEAPEIKHNKTADTETNPVHQGSADNVREIAVNDVLYSEHLSKAGNLGIKVTYICGYGAEYEYVSTQSAHEFARGKAWNFFKQRGVSIKGDIKDVSIDDLLLICNSPEFKKPKTIYIRPQKNNSKYTEIFKVDFGDEEEINPYGVEPEELEDEVPW